MLKYSCLFLVLFVAPAMLAVSASTSEPAVGGWAAAEMSRLGLVPLVETIRVGGEGVAAGQMNWTEGCVVAVGEGKLRAATGQQLEMALRAARLSAVRNAILMTEGVRMGPGGRVNIKDASIEVDAIVKDFREVSSDYDARTETATVRMSVPMHGASGLLRLGKASAAKSSKPYAWPAAKAAKAASVIVIDTGGVGVEPCLFPRVLTEDGQVLLDAGEQSPERPLSRPPLTYCRSTSAASRPAGGNGAVILKAKSGGAGGAIVIDGGSLQLLSACANAQQLMADGKVLVVCDSPDSAGKTQPGVK